MQAYYSTYNELLKENLPQLYDYFTTTTLTPDLYLLDWIYTVFTKAMNLDLASRVWDVFLRDGDQFLFQTALGMLCFHKLRTFVVFCSIMVAVAISGLGDLELTGWHCSHHRGLFRNLQRHEMDKFLLLFPLKRRWPLLCLSSYAPEPVQRSNKDSTVASW